MDILNGIGTLLSWMMAPVEWAINALLSGIGISLPSLPGTHSTMHDFMQVYCDAYLDTSLT
jgi:hypothetical protein